MKKVYILSKKEKKAVRDYLKGFLTCRALGRILGCSYQTAIKVAKIVVHN